MSDALHPRRFNWRRVSMIRAGGNAPPPTFVRRDQSQVIDLDLRDERAPRGFVSVAPLCQPNVALWQWFDRQLGKANPGCGHLDRVADCGLEAADRQGIRDGRETEIDVDEAVQRRHIVRRHSRFQTRLALDLPALIWSNGELECPWFGCGAGAHRDLD